MKPDINVQQEKKWGKKSEKRGNDSKRKFKSKSLDCCVTLKPN